MCDVVQKILSKGLKRSTIPIDSFFLISNTCLHSYQYHQPCDTKCYKVDFEFIITLARAVTKNKMVCRKTKAIHDSRQIHNYHMISFLLSAFVQA